MDKNFYVYIVQICTKVRYNKINRKGVKYGKYNKTEKED